VGSSGGGFLAKKREKSSHSLARELVTHAPWNYHERLVKGHGVISTFLSHLSCKKASARLERSLDQLRPLPKMDWSKPHPASNIGHHTYVIRFKDSSSQQLRIYGHFYDPHHCFVMTADGYEKDDEYYPSNYQESAAAHKRECDGNFVGKTIQFPDYCEVCE
jgi:hypothetical protein